MQVLDGVDTAQGHKTLLLALGSAGASPDSVMAHFGRRQCPESGNAALRTSTSSPPRVLACQRTSPDQPSHRATIRKSFFFAQV